MNRLLIAGLAAWAIYEHDRRVKLEAFARLALPLVVNEMERRGMPVSNGVHKSADRFSKVWEQDGGSKGKGDCGCGGSCSTCPKGTKEIVSDVFSLYAM